MSTINAILEADADGTLHLPLPLELGHGEFKVEAKLEPAGEASIAMEAESKRRLPGIMERIRARNPIMDIENPVALQREMREDATLPGRE
jgi:hypothetical protein